jgi:hypothetical protein
MATEPLDPPQLPVGVDSFGDDLQVERPAELDHDLQKDEVGGLVLEYRDERPIDFELVDRKPMQIGEGAVSGPEVVERDTNAAPSFRTARNTTNPTSAPSSAERAKWRTSGSRSTWLYRRRREQC